MKHIYLLLTLIVLSTGGISIYFSVNLYKNLKIPYLKSHNIIISLLNYQILCGLIFDYYIFNLFEGSGNTLFQILSRIYLLQLSFIIIFCGYFWFKIFFIIQGKKLNKHLRNFLLIIFMVSIGIQLYFMIFPFLEGNLNQNYSLITLILYFFNLIIVFITSLWLVFRKLSKKSKTQISWIKYFAVFVSFTTFSLIGFILLRTLNIASQNFTNILTGMVQLAINTIPIWYLNKFLRTVFPDKYFNTQDNSIKNEVFKEYNISQREAEIINLICQGLSNKEIEKKLYISIRTVKDHIYNIYKKTNLKNRVQLTNLFKNQ